MLCFGSIESYHVLCELCYWVVVALLLYIPVNSYGHVGRVSSPNHTFFHGQAWTSTSIHTFACNWHQPFLNESVEEKKMTVESISWSLNVSMGSGWDQTHHPWICSQTLICSQTCYWLRYAAQHCVIEGQIYKGIIGKWPSNGHFPIISL